MPVILFLNIKGGVAKTTTAVAVAECLACWGHKVLVIDADHQCAASELLLGADRLRRAEEGERTLHDLFLALYDKRREVDGAFFQSRVVSDISNIHKARPSMGVIPGSLRIEELAHKLMDRREDQGLSPREWRAFERRRVDAFRRWLHGQDWSWVVVDCPPAVPWHVRTLLKVADGYVVPSVPDWLSARGVIWLQERLRRIGIGTPALGLVWTLYREIDVHQQMVRSRGHADGFELPKPFDTVIHHAVAISRTAEPDHREKEWTSFAAKYEARFASKFENLTREIVAAASALT